MPKPCYVHTSWNVNETHTPKQTYLFFAPVSRVCPDDGLDLL